MPTGYTYTFNEMNHDLKRWLEESVIRAFGCCVMFRDSNGDISKDKIVETLRSKHKKSVKHHADELLESKKELSSLEKMDKGEIEKAYNDYIKESGKERKKRNKDIRVGADKYINSLSKLRELRKKIIDNSKYSELLSVFDFAIEQLSSTLHHDYNTDRIETDKKEIGLDEFTKSQIDSAKWSIKYHAEELEKTDAREKGRIQFYSNYLEFLMKEF